MKVKDDIDESLRRYKPFISIDYDELINFPDNDEFDCEDERNDFNLVNPDLISF